MIRVALVFLIGAAIMVAAVVAFHHWVGAGVPISKSGPDWGTFGDYFGGVAGTLVSFISILLIVYTIHQQSRQLASVEEETLKRDLLQHIAKADEEIERWLQRKLAGTTDGQVVEFGDVVWGLVKPGYVSSVELTAALERLLKLTCTYCGSIALYKDNINTHFIFQQHLQKAKDLVSFLEQHVGKLSQMAGPSLSICRNHLDG